MNERTTLEKIAPSVDEALAEGLVELGLPAEAVEVEVLDIGSKGILGIGTRQARVRLTVKEISSSPEINNHHPDENISEEDGKLLGLTSQTVNELLGLMKVNGKADVHFGKEIDEEVRPVLVDIHGDNLGMLIGRRAEILNAFQYIVNLIVSRKAEHWVKVIVDVEGYRNRRDHQLRQMARRMADQAIKTGRRQSLEPMTASERRIVHMELRDYPNVTTQSMGEEPSRKVTIVPKE